MKRSRKAQPELCPIYVRPTLDRRERAAARDWCRAAYRGDRYRPKPGEFDPLWLRLGLRMHLIGARAGWVVSNPIHDQLLRRNPELDPSLPGPAWLGEVYRFYGHRGLVQLAGTRSVIKRRREALRAAEEPDSGPMPPMESQNDPLQQQLFSAEETA